MSSSATPPPSTAPKGMTTDTAHIVVGGDEPRQLLYVALLPRPTANHVYLATAPRRRPAQPDPPRRALLPPTAHRRPHRASCSETAPNTPPPRTVQELDSPARQLHDAANPLPRRPRLRRGTGPRDPLPSSTSTGRPRRSGPDSPTSPHTPPSEAHSRSDPSTDPTRSTCFSTSLPQAPSTPHTTAPQSSNGACLTTPQRAPSPGCPPLQQRFPAKSNGAPISTPATNGSATSPTRSVMKARHDPPRPPIRGPRNWSPRPTRTCSAMWRSGARRSA